MLSSKLIATERALTGIPMAEVVKPIALNAALAVSPFATARVKLIALALTPTPDNAAPAIESAMGRFEPLSGCHLAT
jgi:hypothetical protein